MAIGSESVWLGCESGIEKKTRTGKGKAEGGGMEGYATRGNEESAS